jgi:hypothetical protein
VSAINKDLLPKLVASKELGIHPRTLARYVREGRIASVRHAGSTFISRPRPVRTPSRSTDRCPRRRGTGVHPTRYVPMRARRGGCHPVDSVSADPEGTSSFSFWTR